MPSWDLACSSALISPRRAPILARLHTAQLPAALDVEALFEVIFVALFHRLLLPGAAPDVQCATFIVEVIFACAAATDSASTIRTTPLR